ncbi:MAG: sel1 repeat family protein [Clostridia bacterium]|nr:sel1 repeat family protein [Clostridia bacterium]
MTAEKLYELACDTYVRGLCAPDSEKYEEEALELMRAAAAAGHFRAQWNLAEHFGIFGKTKKEQAEALRWYESAAELHGSSVAMYEAGSRYYSGIGVRRQVKKGLYWLERAAERGVGEAIVTVGFHYAFGRSSKKLQKKGFEALNRVNTQEVTYLYEDSTPGELYDLLGDCYRYGKGTEVDEKKAFEFYQAAVDEGRLISRVELGKCYEDGVGVAQNFELAIYNYELISDFCTEAQYRLGLCYLDGRGVPKDEAEGVRWLTEAADELWGDAMYALALCYLDGRGVEKDEAEGVRRMRTAFDEGCCIEAYLYLNKILPEEYPLS